MPINPYDEIVDKEFKKESPIGIIGQDNSLSDQELNPYDDVVGDEFKVAQHGVETSMKLAEDKSPVVRSEAMKISDKYKVPVDFVERNMDTFKKREAKQEQSNMVANSSGLTKYLTDPENAIISKGDFKNLKKIEDGLYDISGSKQEDITTLPGELIRAGRTGWYSLKGAGWQLGAAYGLGDIDTIAENVAENNRRAAEFRKKIPDYSKEFNEKLDKESGDVSKAFDRAVGSYDELKKGNIIEALKDFSVGGISTVGESLDLIQEAVRRPRGLIYSTTESLANSFPSLVTGAIAGSAVPVAGTLVGFVAGGFVGQVPIEIGAWVNQSLQEKGYDTTNADDLKKAYRDPVLMREIREEAERKGITTAAVDSLFTVVAGKSLSKVGKKASIIGKTKAIARDIGIQSIGEAGSEFAGQVAARKGFEGTDFGEAVMEGVISMGHSFGETLVGASMRVSLPKDTVDATTELGKASGEAVETIQQLGRIKDMSDAVQESTTADMAPHKIQEFINTVDSPENPTSVYYQSNDFDDFWAARGQSPIEKASELMGDSGKAYMDAKETGGSIEVPIGKLAEGMAKSADINDLIEIARATPDGMNFTEAKETISSLPATMEELAKEAETYDVIDHDGFDNEARAIAKDVQTQLEATGVKTRDARLQAEVYKSAFGTLAKRNNISPKELFSRYGLKIREGTAVQPKADADSKRLFQEDGEEGIKRGQIDFGEDNKFTISLLEGANKSTFLHETGHLFLEVFKDLSSREGAPGQTIDDYSTIKEFLEIGEDGKTTIEQHEKFARGFEAYLFEGKAPTPQLRKAFAAFKEWMVSIYRKIKNLDVELTQDVKDVFDRLLATDDEINDSESELGRAALFPEPENMGMSVAQSANYRESIKGAKDHAQEKVTKNVMQVEQKKLTKEWQQDFKREKESIINSLNDNQVYRSINIMKTGLDKNGESVAVPGLLKLNRSELEKFYTKEFIDSRIKPHGIVSTSEGGDIEFVAATLGFKSGDDLVQSIAKSPKEKDFIEMEATRRLMGKYPDPMVDGSIDDAAKKAIHSDNRAKILRLELEHLATNNLPALKEIIRRVTRKVPPAKAIKSQAIKTVASQKVKDIRPFRFMQAEARAAKEAGVLLARGDVKGAFDSKLKELLNHEMYRESLRVKEDVDKNVKKFRRMFKKDGDLAKNRDIDLVNAARAVLSSYGLGKTDKTAQDYIAGVKEYDSDVYEMLQELIGSTVEEAENYKEADYNKFSRMAVTVEALWNHSREVKQVEIDGAKLSVQEAVDDMVGRLGRFTKQKPAGLNETASDRDKLSVSLKGLKALIRRFEGWVDVMDLGDVKGPFRKFLFQGVSEASDKYVLDRGVYKKRFIEASQDITFESDSIEAKEINFRFRNKGELIGALLHTGNEGNLRKLLVGYGWGELQENGGLTTGKWDNFVKRMQDEGVLTKKDYDYVQKLWDMMEEVKPQSQQAHKKIFGYYFNEITTKSFSTPFGDYRGGYAPAKVDPNLVLDIARKDELDKFIKGHTSYTYPAAGGRGFTKSRIEDFNKPLLLDVRLFTKHMDDVLKFSIVKPAVIDAAKIIMNPQFKEAMNLVDPTAIDGLIKPSLQRADKQEITSVEGHGPVYLQRIMGYMRKTASLQIMFGNVVNTVEQLTGISPALTKVPAKNLMVGLKKYMSGPRQLAQAISEKSKFMETRYDGQIFEMEKAANKILVPQTKTQKMKVWIEDNAFFAQQFTQNIVDSIVWQGSYDQSLSKGLSGLESVRKADSDVRLTQSSSRPLDISRAEANPFIRVFQMFMSYFNMIGNLLISEGAKAKHGDLEVIDKYKRGAFVALTTVTAPAILSALLRRAAGGAFDEDEDGEYTDDAMDVLFGSQINYLLATIPVAGTAIQAGLNRLDNKVYNDRMSASPAFTALTTVVGAPISIAKTLSTGKGKKKAVRDGFTAAGIMLNLPLRSAAKPIGYLIDIDEGKARPTGPIDFTRGLITGRK